MSKCTVFFRGIVLWLSLAGIVCSQSANTASQQKPAIPDSYVFELLQGKVRFEPDGSGTRDAYRLVARRRSLSCAKCILRPRKPNIIRDR